MLPLLPAESASQSDTTIRLFSRWTLLGVLLYFVNMVADDRAGIPAAELAVSGLMFLSFLLQKQRTNRTNVAGIFFGVTFVALVFLTGLANNLGNTEIVRNVIKTSMLLFPVAIYPLLEDKRHILSVIIGIIVGFTLHYGGTAVLQLVTIGEIARKIRSIQPTPIIYLMILFCLKDVISAPLKKLCWAAIGLTFAIAVIIQSRGALLSLAFGGMFYLIGRLAGRGLPSIVPATIIFMLSLHIILGTLFSPVMDRIYQLDMVTVSNLERAFLIDLSVQQIIPENPWTGVGLTHFSNIFYNTGYKELPLGNGLRIESPHNSFLNVAVYYGLPALLFFALMLFSFSRFAIKYSLLAPALTAMSLSLLARHGMFFDYSGVYRLEILLMWAIVFYRISKPVIWGRPDFSPPNAPVSR